MAGPLDLSAFDSPAPQAAPAAPAAVSLDAFDAPAAPAAPAAVDLNAFDDPGIPIQAQYAVAPDVPIEEKAANFVTGLVPEPVKDVGKFLGQQVIKSPVGKLIEQLNRPLKAASAAVVTGLEKTVSPGIEEKLNPDRSWQPEIAYHDIVNYLAPSNDQVQKLAEKYGVTGVMSDATRLAYAVGKGGLGLAADLFLDPINAVSFGTLTPAGKALSAAGKAAQAERYAVAVGGFGREVGITTGAVRKGIEAIPGGKALTSEAGRTALKTGAGAIAGASLMGLGPAGAVLGGAAGAASSRIAKAFDYRTGIEEIDNAASLHAAFKRGDQGAIFDSFVKPLTAKKFSETEAKVLSSAIEGTENAADKAALIKVAKERAARDGLSIPESRFDDIAEAGLRIKAENALDFDERVAAGLVSETAQATIENYLVHKISPEAKAALKKNPELAATLEEVMLARKAQAATRDSNLSTYDSQKMGRKLRTTLEEANAILKEKTGVTKFFIEDPIVATAMKRAETRKLVRDKELIERIKNYGIPKAKAKEMGLVSYRKIDTPEFRGSTVADDLVFPPEIADKLGYYITPRETNGFFSFLDSYNRVFRTVALAKPDYYLQNYGENIFKNWVQGVKISDYVDTLKVARNRGTIEIAGKQVPASEVRKLVMKYGIDSGGQFREGFEPLLFAGKRMEQERIALRVAGKTKDSVAKAFNLMREAGEKGENQTRRALFVGRLKQGYTPDAAALEVEKYLFDFSRNSKATDAFRRFYDPFIQAAIKSGYILPEMIGKSPGKFNFLHNNLMQTLEASFQDPVTANEVKLLLPEYRQIQDPVVGPFLAGNSWLAKIFASGASEENQKTVLGDKKVMLFKLPIGADILNRWSIWDSQIGKQGGVASPLLRSFMMTAVGKDPFTGQDLDPVKGKADMARRLNYAFASALENATPMPNTVKWLKQQVGIGDPQYFTPTSVLMLHANLGKFATVTNLDREYFFRTIALDKARKSLVQQLAQRSARERSGRTSDMAASDKPYLKRVADIVNKYEKSTYIYQELMNVNREAAITKMAAGGLAGDVEAAEIVLAIKDIDRTVKAMVKQYETMSDYRLQLLKDAREEQIKELVPESQREPQSLGRRPQSVESNNLVEEALDEESDNYLDFGDLSDEALRRALPGLDQEQADLIQTELNDRPMRRALRDEFDTDEEMQKIFALDSEQLEQAYSYIERGDRRGAEEYLDRAGREEEAEPLPANPPSKSKDLRSRKPTKKEAEFFRKAKDDWGQIR